MTADDDGDRLLLGSHRGGGAEPPELSVPRTWAQGIPVADVALCADGALDDLDFLRMTVIRGRATVDGIAAALGAAVGAVHDSSDRLRSQGMLVEAGGGWRASAAGREVVEREAAGLAKVHGSVFAALLRDFVAPDGVFKQLVTDWQLASPSGDTDTVVARLLREVHPQATRIIAVAARLVPRLYGYQRRLDHALLRLQSGDPSFLAHPGVESYHTIWFEFHEELITISGSTRAAGPAA